MTGECNSLAGWIAARVRDRRSGPRPAEVSSPMRPRPCAPSRGSSRVAAPGCCPTSQRCSSLRGMSQWVTQVEAAALLGVHRSLIPKMVRRGDLISHPRRPSLLKQDVLDLFLKRQQAATERQLRKKAPAKTSIPPDGLHDWLPAPAAAAVMGCSVVALNARARRGKVPSALKSGRRWYRLDHLELQVRAEAARRSTTL